MATASNIWRNNFNIQKGFGCYGTDVEIDDPTFRNQSRKLCPHLVAPEPDQLNGAWCDLETAARYRNEDHPKVFRIDPVTREHFVYDPSNIDHYAPLVLAPSGQRLPIVALIVALYHDSPLAAGRTHIDLHDFLVDFDFTPAEALAYFDDDPALPEHQALVATFPSQASWTRIPATGTAAPAATLPGVPLSPPTPIGPVTLVPIAAPPTVPPAGGHWWDAEQAVRQALTNDGWTVVDVSRLGIGYDLRAFKGGTLRHVEVKSSAGLCAPVLTPNEVGEARRLGDAYVLAVVENFEPSQPVSILWVQNPAQFSMGVRQITVYSLPRSLWMRGASATIH